MQLRLLQTSPRRYAEQYFVVPCCALYVCEFSVKLFPLISTYRILPSPEELDAFIASIQLAASSFRAKVT